MEKAVVMNVVEALRDLFYYVTDLLVGEGVVV